MNYYLSVDGGGSKTDFMLQSTDERVVYRVRTGPVSIKSVGEDTARANLADGILRLLTQSEVQKENIIHAVFGISGCDSRQEELRLHEMIQALGWSAQQYTLCNDGVLAFYAGTVPPGMVLIAGTGSIVIGVDSEGSITRTGGWGYGFSDAGSGYWLGSRALEHTLLYCDGCAPYRPWFDDVRNALNAPDFAAVPEIATNLNQSDSVAALARVLLCDTRPEPLRESIISEGAGHLAALAAANYRKMCHMAGESFSLVFAGGCLQHQGYAAMVAEKLSGLLRTAFTPVSGSAPVEGGIRLCKIMVEGQAPSLHP